MKKVNLKHMMLGAVAVCAIAIIPAKLSASEGCRVVPTDLKGSCEKNTEGSYTCIVTSWLKDCTSTN
jgi:hypothetical protein